jgi:hypothetical protein
MSDVDCSRQAGASLITEEMVEAASKVLADSGLLYFEVFEKDPCPVTVRKMLEAALLAKSESRTGSDRN